MKDLYHLEKDHIVGRSIYYEIEKIRNDIIEETELEINRAEEISRRALEREKDLIELFENVFPIYKEIEDVKNSKLTNIELKAAVEAWKKSLDYRIRFSQKEFIVVVTANKGWFKELELWREISKTHTAETVASSWHSAIFNKEHNVFKR